MILQYFRTFETQVAIRFRQMVREFLPEATYPSLEGFWIAAYLFKLVGRSPIKDCGLFTKNPLTFDGRKRRLTRSSNLQRRL